MLDGIRQSLGEAATHEVVCGDDVLTLTAQALPAALRMLRDEFGFSMLTDLFGMDGAKAGTPPERRFAVVYQVLHLAEGRRLRLKAFLPESSPEIPSAAGIWASADWLEREVWDLFGIRFRGHPDLKRILLPEGYDGHPLRKDYPMQGHGERDNFPKYTTQTPLGDLLKQQEGLKEHLA